MMKEIHVGFRRVLGAWPEVCVSTPYTRVSPVFYFFFRSLIDLVNFRKKMAWVFQTPTQLLYFLTILYIVPHHHHIPTLLTLAFFLVLRMKTAPHDRRRSFGIVTTAQEEDLCSDAQKKKWKKKLNPKQISAECPPTTVAMYPANIQLLDTRPSSGDGVRLFAEVVTDSIAKPTDDIVCTGSTVSQIKNHGSIDLFAKL